MQTTVQDLGRFGYGRYGLPVAGALDDCALRWANLLVGNEPGAAALEVTLLGPTLTLEGERPVVAALAGADFGATLNGAPVTPWRSFTLRPGDTLALGGCRWGARGYLAVAGGIPVPAVFDSRSTDLLGGLGGLEGRALRPGDLLPLAPPEGEPPPRALPAHLVPRYGQEIVARVVFGPQDDRFTEDAIVAFLSSRYTVARESNRMGLRLEGPGLAYREGSGGPDILSEGVVTGAVQVPGHGHPIVLLAGRQTTGGYAKIATVIGADLWWLGQARPGDIVRFRRVSVAQAREALRVYRSGFDAGRLVTVAAGQVGGGQAAAATGAVPQAAPAALADDLRREVAGVARAIGERLRGPGEEQPPAAVWRPEDVRELLDQVARLDLAEFAIDVPGFTLRLRRGSSATGRALEAPGSPAGDAPAQGAAPGEFTVTAPLLGVFFRSPRPGEPPFVQPGDVVEADRTLGLIEVMKTFHQVTAGRRARVVAALTEDGAPVEYGQPLFTLAALRDAQGQA